MGPEISAFLLGLLTAATKVSFLAVLALGVGWWDSHRRLKRLQAAPPDLNRLEERLASLESATDYTASQVDRILEAQAALARQLSALPLHTALPAAPERDNQGPRAEVSTERSAGG
jgi:hypothetical protein